jgi:hypothetical protein
MRTPIPTNTRLPLQAMAAIFDSKWKLQMILVATTYITTELQVFAFYRHMHHPYLYCNGFAQSVSRQRFGKHVPTCNNGRCVSVDECYNLLLGNSQCANQLAG